MDFSVYKLLHLIGLILLFLSLGGLILIKTESVLGAAPSPVAASRRRLALMSHGIALLLLLISGFGMLAKLGLFASLPLWAYVKMVIWLILGGLVAWIKKPQVSAKLMWWVTLALGALAAALGLHVI